MKTDVQLKNDVAYELAWEPSVTPGNITVVAHDGVVTLTGTVPYYAEKWAAERAAKRVHGVKAIAEELDVNLIGVHSRKDSDIAQAVVTALEWHVWVPKSVQAVVEDGWVTLTGSVKRGFEREAAEDAVRYLSGVKGVTNNVRVKSDIHPGPVKEAIEKALKRDAELDAEHIKVTADGSTVTLTGKIRSWSDRDQAGLAAWSAPGVTEVRNEIAVSY